MTMNANLEKAPRFNGWTCECVARMGDSALWTTPTGDELITTPDGLRFPNDGGFSELSRLILECR